MFLETFRNIQCGFRKENPEIFRVTRQVSVTHETRCRTSLFSYRQQQSGVVLKKKLEIVGSAGKMNHKSLIHMISVTS